MLLYVDRVKPIYKRLVNREKRRINMSNNNLKNCMTALQVLNITDAKITIGKNPKQATRLILSDGRNISVSAVTTVSNFMDLLQADKTSHDNSIAKSKHNPCNPKPKDDEYKELQMWLDKKSTYAKKCMYLYEFESLFDIITYTIEDFGYYPEQIKMYHDLWNSEKTHGSQKANKSMLVFCNGKYTPFEPLRMTIKQWLSAHKRYNHSDEQLDMIIKNYVNKVEG